MSSLRIEDSVLTFNWDLLLDQEFHPLRLDLPAALHYNNFFGLCLKQSLLAEGGLVIIQGPYGEQGRYLKLHGSLNWFYCSNAKCPAHQELTIDRNCSRVLHRAMGIHFSDESCQRCGSATSPLLIPPLLRKPIVENWIIRSMWGIARRRLAAAQKVVLIGFSAAPTDFYSAWLLRSTVGCRREARVFVVNPENAEDHPNHRDFQERMDSIFSYGYDSKFTSFSQIDEIIESLRHQA